MGKIETSLHRQASEGLSGRKIPRAIMGAQSLAILAGATEYLLIAAACYQAGALYHRLMFGHLPYSSFYLAATFCLAAMFVLPCGLSRDYSIKRLLDSRAQLQSVFLHWNSAYAIFVFALFMIHATDFYSRGAIAVRLAIAQFAVRSLEKGMLVGNRVLVIGDTQLVDETVWRLRRDRKGVEIAATINLDWHLPSILDDELRVALEKAEALARHDTVDDVIICLPWAKGDLIR